MNHSIVFGRWGNIATFGGIIGVVTSKVKRGGSHTNSIVANAVSGKFQLWRQQEALLEVLEEEEAA